MNEATAMAGMIDAATREPRTVGDIMTPNPIVLNEEDNLAIVQEEMRNLGLRHIPVVDGNKLVGLVTHRDLLQHTLGTLHHSQLLTNLDAHDKREYFVADIMTRDVRTARLDTPIGEAAAELANGRFGCLPVVAEDGTLLGIVSENDLVKLIAAHASAAPIGPKAG